LNGTGRFLIVIFQWGAINESMAIESCVALKKAANEQEDFLDLQSKR
jgi:hypothetical protein